MLATGGGGGSPGDSTGGGGGGGAPPPNADLGATTGESPLFAPIDPARDGLGATLGATVGGSLAATFGGSLGILSLRLTNRLPNIRKNQQDDSLQESTITITQLKFIKMTKSEVKSFAKDIRSFQIRMCKVSSQDAKPKNPFNLLAKQTIDGLSCNLGNVRC